MAARVWCPATARSPRRSRGGQAGAARRQQDRRSRARSRRARVVSARIRSGLRDRRRARRRGRRSARRDRRAAARGRRASAAAPSPSEVAVAIVGRPNAGKSSLVNRLLREERMIVSEVPGTTRDAVDTVLTWHRRQFRIVDTAGIRRPGRVARRTGRIRSACCWRGARSSGRRRRARDRRVAGRRPIRMRRSPARPIGWARRHHRRQQVGPDEGQRVPTSSRRSTRARAQLKFLDYAPILHISRRPASARRGCSKRSTRSPSRGSGASRRPS